MPPKKVLKLYYLSTCSTCARIMKDLKIKNYPFELQDIKTQNITEEQIDEGLAIISEAISIADAHIN